MPIAAVRQFLIKVNGIDGFFSEKSGGETEADANREFDGGSLTPEVLTGPAIPQDLTVRRPYKPERDAAIVARYRALVGRWRTSITVQPTDLDLVAVGQPEVYQGILRRIAPPDANAGSGDAAKLELVFVIELVG